MLTKPGVSVADLLQIQEKLAEAQAELDSEATQRKILANETEKIYIEIALHAEQRTISRGAFASVGEALRDFGSVLGDSLAALITAIAAVIPWVDRDRSRAVVPDKSHSPVPGTSPCREGSHTSRVV